MLKSLFFFFLFFLSNPLQLSPARLVAQCSRQPAVVCCDESYKFRKEATCQECACTVHENLSYYLKILTKLFVFTSCCDFILTPADARRWGVTTTQAYFRLHGGSEKCRRSLTWKKTTFCSHVREQCNATAQATSWKWSESSHLNMYSDIYVSNDKNYLMWLRGTGP